MRITIAILATLLVCLIFCIFATEIERRRGYSNGFDDGFKSAIYPITNLEDFCDELERFDKDIVFTWVRQDGAQMEMCVRGSQREMYVFSLPAHERPEYLRVIGSKPLWFEDGTFGLRDGDWTER